MDKNVYGSFDSVRSRRNSRRSAVRKLVLPIDFEKPPPVETGIKRRHLSCPSTVWNRLNEGRDRLGR